MSDPNADLIGRTYTTAEGVLVRVVRTASWSPQYVEVEPHGSAPTVRNAGLVRARLSREDT